MTAESLAIALLSRLPEELRLDLRETCIPGKSAATWGLARFASEKGPTVTSRVKGSSGESEGAAALLGFSAALVAGSNFLFTVDVVPGKAPDLGIG